MENEAVVRTKSLVWWSGYIVVEVANRMANSKRERELEDSKAVEELVNITREIEREELNDSTKAVLSHIAGYLVRSATKSNKCGACANLQVDRLAAPFEMRFEETGQVDAIIRSFSDLLDRCRLLAPSSTAIELTLMSCYTWKWLMKEETNRCKLPSVTCQGWFSQKW